MRRLTHIFLILCIGSLLISCGSREQSAEEDAETASETVQDISEDVRTSAGGEAARTGTATEIGEKVLHAVKNENVEGLKQLVFPALAVVMDEQFVSDLAEKYLADWDGSIREVRYRKDPRSGMVQAVVYFSDATGSGADNKIHVHILVKGEEEGTWFGFGKLGFVSGFETIDNETFAGYMAEYPSE
ncbi:MAG TPA: hypothetical protein VKA68_07740 [bacterium]|nr:hypothetical protein [bacterium]